MNTLNLTLLSNSVGTFGITAEANPSGLDRRGNRVQAFTQVQAL